MFHQLPEEAAALSFTELQELNDGERRVLFAHRTLIVNLHQSSTVSNLLAAINCETRPKMRGKFRGQHRALCLTKSDEGRQTL